MFEVCLWKAFPGGGGATVWDPNPEKSAKFAKNLQKLYKKYRAELFPNDLFASGDVLYCILY